MSRQRNKEDDVSFALDQRSLHRRNDDLEIQPRFHPHFSGLREADRKQMKIYLKRTVGEDILKD